MPDWYNYLSGLGTIQGVLLVILLVSRKNNRKANSFLGAFIVVLLVSLTEHWYQPIFSGLVNQLLGGLLFLYGPLIVLYVQTLLGERILVATTIRHFSAFGLYVILLLGCYLFGEVEGDSIELILAHMLFIHLFYYSYISLNKLFRESRKKEPSVSMYVINWLKAFTGILTAIYIFAFIGMYLRILEIDASSWILFAVQTGCVAVVYGLSYWSLVQPEMIGKAQQSVKYAQSGLSEQEKERLLHSIFSCIALDKPYLQSTLTLEQFAKNLGTNRFYISQVINERTGKNFSDFINTYRIEEAKRLLSDNKKSHYSIVGIGYEAGFNSKTAFNAAFKKLTGQTPTEYRKWQQKGVPIDQTGQ